MNKNQTRVATACRQSVAILGLALLIGCGSSQQTRLAGANQGGIAADEPRAVTVAQSILAAGGSAADAAVATAFTLSVTYPVASSLGGGGVCVIFDGPTGSAESLEFLPRTPSSGGSVSVPGMVRGLAALHARYGRLPWAEVVAPAEALARNGHPLSQAMARNIAAVRDEISKSETLLQWLARDQKKIIEEGDGFVQTEISSTLGLLRTRGAGDLYGGLLARQFVEAASRIGGAVSMQDLREYVPIWGETAQAKTGDLTLHTAPLPIAGGTIAGQIWLMLTSDGSYRQASLDERSHLVVEVLLRAYADIGVSPVAPISTFHAHTLMRTYDPSAHTAQTSRPPPRKSALPVIAGGDGVTGFVVGDNDGSTVACNLTLGSPFGIGAWDKVTGIVRRPLLSAPMSAPLF